MSRSKEYKEKNVVGDWTVPLSKLWDNLVPTTFPYILEFKTNYAKEVVLDRSFGPYHHEEHFIDYDVDVVIDNQPLIDVGWDGGKISNELAKKAYGENYFNDLREKLIDLSKYAGLKFSHFDLNGVIHAKAKDL